MDKRFAVMAGIMNAFERPAEKTLSVCPKKETSSCADFHTHFNDTLTPALTSLAACCTFFGVSQFKVPSWSFSSPLSQSPHAQPWGIFGTFGRSLKSGASSASMIAG